jgi:hypothetical protein
MSVTRVGATKQYSDNWDNIFAGGARRSSATKSTAKTTKKSPKKSAKRAATTRGKNRSVKAKRKAR